MSSQYRIELAIFKLTWPDEFYHIKSIKHSYLLTLDHAGIDLLIFCFPLKAEKVLQLLRLFNRDGGFHMVISKDSVPATYWDVFFLQRVQVVDSQCCGLWNLTITELDSILCLLYRSNFVRQKFRPFHIILKWTRSYMNLSRISRCEFSFIYWPWQFDFVNR